VNVRALTRNGAALVAGAALFATASSDADAVTTTFIVSTTITRSCVVSDAGPPDLAPTYSPTIDAGTGDHTVLNTTCNGATPTVTFTDAYNSGGTVFQMTNGASALYYQISNGTSCSGVASDNPVQEGVPQVMAPGNGAYDICVSVLAAGGTNTNAPAGTYTDTVTYTLTP
jgi:spore coat protein U-like protein